MWSPVSTTATGIDRSWLRRLGNVSSGLGRRVDRGQISLLDDGLFELCFTYGSRLFQRGGASISLLPELNGPALLLRVHFWRRRWFLAAGHRQDNDQPQSRKREQLHGGRFCKDTPAACGQMPQNAPQIMKGDHSGGGAGGRTRTDTGDAHKILSLARLPISPHRRVPRRRSGR